MPGLTRRALLVRGAGACVLLVTSGGAPPRAAAAAPALSPERRAVLGALLTAVAVDPATGLAVSVVELTADDFERAYAAAPAPLREHAGEVLDRLGAAAFTVLSAAEAHAALRDWSLPGADPGLAAAALDLASLSFEEDELRQVGYVLDPA